MEKEVRVPISRMLPCSVTFLSVGTKNRQDAMTASAMFISENPLLLMVSVAKHIVSHDLIEQAGEFVLNLASTKQIKLARQIGFTHGGEVDKFKKFGIRTGKLVKSRPLRSEGPLRIWNVRSSPLTHWVIMYFTLPPYPPIK